MDSREHLLRRDFAYMKLALFFHIDHTSHEAHYPSADREAFHSLDRTKERLSTYSMMISPYSPSEGTRNPTYFVGPRRGGHFASWISSRGRVDLVQL